MNEEAVIKTHALTKYYGKSHGNEDLFLHGRTREHKVV